MQLIDKVRLASIAGDEAPPPLTSPPRAISALTPIADILDYGWNVRFVPKADIPQS